MQLSDLYPYQLNAVNFLLDVPKGGKPHKILAHEPGLGKTFTACAAIKKANLKSAKIICPPTVKDQWRDALIEWGVADEKEIFLYEKVRDQSNKPFQICGWQLMRMSETVFKSLAANKSHVVIGDEIQKCKGFTSTTSALFLGAGHPEGKATRDWEARGPLIATGYHKWGLSGTLIPNRPIELYPALKTLAPERIDNMGYEAYGRYYCDGFVEGFGGFNFKGASHINELKGRLFNPPPFIDFKRVEDVFDQLPDVIESDYTIDIELDGLDETNTAHATLTKEIGLRKVPAALEYLVERLREEPETKILVFAWNTEVIDRLALGLKEFDALKLYGECSASEKQFAKDQFKTNPACRVLVAQNTVVDGVNGFQYISRDIVSVQEEWSPGTWEQMIRRLRRIGQIYPVRVVRLFARRTYEQTIYYSRQKKGRIISQIFSPTIEITDDEINRIGGFIEMTVESELKRVADALEKIVERGGIYQQGTPQVEQKAPASKPKDKPATTEKNGATLQDMQKTALEVTKRLNDAYKKLGQVEPGSMDSVRKDVAAAIAPLGLKTVIEAKPEQMGAVIDALKAIPDPQPQSEESSLAALGI